MRTRGVLSSRCQARPLPLGATSRGLASSRLASHGRLASLGLASLVALAVLGTASSALADPVYDPFKLGQKPIRPLFAQGPPPSNPSPPSLRPAPAPAP